MGYVHDYDITYSSSLDSSLTLSYDFSYDDTLLNKPLCLVMHAFTGTASEITEEIKERLLAYGVCVIAPEMRGRGDADGDEDCNGLELYDVYDAIVDAISIYSTRIDSNKIHAPTCISGGCGNGYKLVCAFPDLFGVVGLFFGISDYGYDNTDGWWWTNSVRRATLESWIGDTPSNIPDKYYVRGGVFFVDNAKYSDCNVYQDNEDTSVPIVNATNLQDRTEELNYTNWTFNLTGSGDDPRWIHGYPWIGGPGEPNIQAEPYLFEKINSGNYDNPTINITGIFRIPSYLRTKEFSVFLGDGLTDAGTINYNLIVNTYTIKNNLVTLNNNVSVKFERYNLLPYALYDVYINGVKYHVAANGSGTMLWDSNTLDATESLTIEIRGISMTTQKIFGEGGGAQISRGNKCTHVFSGSPTKSFASDVQQNITDSRKILLRWELESDIPTNATVDSAILTIFLSKNAVAANIDAHKILTDWGVTTINGGSTEIPATAGQATWDNSHDFNSGSDEGWAAGVGAGYSSADRSAYEKRVVLSGAEVVDDAITFDISTMVQEWIETPEDNHGVSLECLVVADNRFHSQYAVNTSLRPYLTINYNTPDESEGEGPFNKVNVQGDALTARANHRTIVFKGKLNVLMGYNGTSRLGDMYTTKGGQKWERHASLIDNNGNTISNRDSFGLCEHNNKVYLLGGWNGSSYYNDVYVTENMVSWKRIQNAPWSARYGMVVLSFDNRLWVIGGINSVANLNDVWWTRDGVNWVQETNAPWAARRYACGFVFDNAMYVIGGIGASRYNDINYSQNGRSWSKITGPFTARDLFAAELHGDNKIVIIGGQTGAGVYSSELWQSWNGLKWYRGITAMQMRNLRGHSLNYFNKRLYIIGGIRDTTYKSDVWEANKETFAAK